MKIVIRVDASTAIGTGHLMRCRTLARELRSQGNNVVFVCRNHPGSLINPLLEEGFTVHELPAPAEAGHPQSTDYSAWLGATQAQDATDTRATLVDKPDWLIVDHYSLNIEWEQRLSADAKHLMVIDDLASRDHSCDVLLDQNYSCDQGARYSGRIPAECTLMLGPRYALLQPEYAAYRTGLQSHPGRVRRIFIFFGGTDPDNLTGLSLQALEESDLRDTPVDAIMGPNNPNRKALFEQAERMPQVILHSPRPHLADLMAKADLAIGAGGTTTWERCCLGLPSVVISIADNQKPACERLSQDGVIHYAGPHEAVSVESLRSTITALARSPETLKRLSVASINAVDGIGCARVASQLRSIAQTQRTVS